MRYDFLIATYETECVKVSSVWSEFKDEELPVRPRQGDPRGRSVHEQAERFVRIRDDGPCLEGRCKRDGSIFGRRIGPPPAGRHAWPRRLALFAILTRCRGEGLHRVDQQLQAQVNPRNLRSGIPEALEVPVQRLPSGVDRTF
jgi:hypothetical protein